MCSGRGLQSLYGWIAHRTLTPDMRVVSHDKLKKKKKIKDDFLLITFKEKIMVCVINRPRAKHVTKTLLEESFKG